MPQKLLRELLLWIKEIPKNIFITILQGKILYIFAIIGDVILAWYLYMIDHNIYKSVLLFCGLGFIVIPIIIHVIMSKKIMYDLQQSTKDQRISQASEIQKITQDFNDRIISIELSIKELRQILETSPQNQVAKSKSKLFPLKEALGMYTNAFQFFNSEEHFNESMFRTLKLKEDTRQLVPLDVYQFLKLIENKDLKLYGYRSFINKEIEVPHIDIRDIDFNEFYKQDNFDQDYTAYKDKNCTFVNLSIDRLELAELIKRKKELDTEVKRYLSS